MVFHGGPLFPEVNPEGLREPDLNRSGLVSAFPQGSRESVCLITFLWLLSQLVRVKALALKLLDKAGPCLLRVPLSLHLALAEAESQRGRMAWFLCLSVLVVLVLALAALLWRVRTRDRPQEAPSLPYLPVLGSLLSLRSPHPPHVLFKELQQKYGQTYSLKMGSHQVIIVNHHAHAREVLLKRGRTFAGRPRTVGTCR